MTTYRTCTDQTMGTATGPGPDSVPTDPAAPAITFVHVPAGFVHEPGILALAATGIATGVVRTTTASPGSVTRGQMAAFVHRAVLQDTTTGLAG